MQNNVIENIESLRSIQLTSNLVKLKERNLIDKKRTYLSVKRTSDVVLSGLALIALSPVIGLIGALIKLDSKGKVFYKQKRIGKNGEYFTIYKFRTMVNDANDFDKYFSEEQLSKFKENYKLEDDPRITRVGKFLRKTSLDELPQLLNIIKGDLSIIGPRPIVDEEIEKYGLDKDKFLSVTPGLTGNWAANGRSCTTYEERIKLELDYIDNLSLKTDLKVFFKTIITVLKGKGAV